jgi:hypothetical protein
MGTVYDISLTNTPNIISRIITTDELTTTQKLFIAKYLNKTEDLFIKALINNDHDICEIIIRDIEVSRLDLSRIFPYSKHHDSIVRFVRKHNIVIDKLTTPCNIIDLNDIENIKFIFNTDVEFLKYCIGNRMFELLSHIENINDMKRNANFINNLIADAYDEEIIILINLSFSYSMNRIIESKNYDLIKEILRDYPMSLYDYKGTDAEIKKLFNVMEINYNKNVCCDICRLDSDVNKVVILPCNVECTMCCETVSKLVMLNCGHAVRCKACYSKMPKVISNDSRTTGGVNINSLTVTGFTNLMNANIVYTNNDTPWYTNHSNANLVDNQPLNANLVNIGTNSWS